MKRLTTCLVLAIALATAACSPSQIQAICITGAKAVCSLSGMIPTVGGTVSGLCEAFAASPEVANLCGQAGASASDKLAALEAWLAAHKGVAALVDTSKLALAKARLRVVAPPTAATKPGVVVK